MFFDTFCQCSGDTDAVVPVTGTRLALNKLNLTIITSWYPWYSGNQVIFITLIFLFIMQSQWFYMVVVVIGWRMDGGIQRAYLRDSKRSGPRSAGIATGACSHSFKIVLGRQRASKILLVTQKREKTPCETRVNSVFSFPIYLFKINLVFSKKIFR